ncbi:MAG TPA: DnaJ C-terminal domain-containing protein [Candidatus Cybelea sp.]|nr:DnaJ C-terminal domain-containing protein [Candidatus Cybelea sp.]
MADPYKTLGVAPSATADEIKKAYRKLAKRLHPDVNPGNKKVEQQFKEATAAYDLLSDAEKRRKFDAGEIDENGNPRGFAGWGGRGYGGSGGAGGTGTRGRGPRAADLGLDDEFAEDLFRDFFNFGRGGAGRAGVKMRGADVSYKAEVSFLEAARGAKKRLTLSDGKTLDITIPAGTLDGQTLRLKGQGLPGSGGASNGDAFVEITVTEHPYFERDGNDVLLECPISLAEAVLGGQITVPTVDGQVSLKVPKNSNTGTQLRLKGKGIVDPRSGQRGDQFVRFVVMLPRQMDAELEQSIDRWAKSHGTDADVREKFSKS